LRGRKAASGFFVRGGLAVPPASVRKRDGSLAPFDPEKLARSLFAAAESLGGPDAFLARELADGVLHFLAGDAGEDPLPTTALAELTAKVVRELGHPALARAYETFRSASPAPAPRPKKVDEPGERFTPADDPFAILERSARAGLEAYSLEHVYPRDLAAAHRDGLLRLLDLGTPQEMLGVVLSPQQPPPLDGWELLGALEQARAAAGSFVAIDGPEHAVAAREGIPEEMASAFLAALDRCLRVTRLRSVLNLNTAEPPPWAAPLDPGPLFRDFQKEMAGERLDRIALYLLRHARERTVYWHLGERDFGDEAAPRLAEVAGRALARDGVEFVFDRPGRPVALGPGIDRKAQAVLGAVGIDLPRLAGLGGATGQDVFFRKLASLTRFARSAGRARRDYLREHGRPPLREGFLLERAVELITPFEVTECARIVLGGAADFDGVAAFSCRVMEAIHATLEADSQAPPARLDSLPETPVNGEAGVANKLLPRQQLRYGVARSDAAASGSLTIFLNQTAASSVNEITDLIRTAWRTSVPRLRFARGS
jgi:hypothetical protein